MLSLSKHLSHTTNRKRVALRQRCFDKLNMTFFYSYPRPLPVCPAQDVIQVLLGGAGVEQQNLLIGLNLAGVQ